MRPLICLCLAGVALAQQPPAPLQPPGAGASDTAPLSAEQIEQEHLRRLLGLRRVYVDRLSGGDSAEQVRDMVISALERSRLFIVTEDESKADAYLRGSAEDSVFTETRASREGITARASGRIGSSRSRYDGDSASGAVGVGDSDDFYSKERKHEAMASVRLVARDGDVLWSSTQESQGAKYKGSAADVADKIGKDLAEAFARARKLATSLAGEGRREPRPGAPPSGKPTP